MSETHLLQLSTPPNLPLFCLRHLHHCDLLAAASLPHPQQPTTMSFASALCRTPLVASPTPRRASRHAGRRAVAPRAFAAPQQLWQLAEAAAAAKPGEVDAPISAIIIGGLKEGCTA